MTKNYLKESRVMFTPSLRSGKRINRNYVNGIDYKPLVEKTNVKADKPRVLIIHDCSGSMGH